MGLGDGRTALRARKIVASLASPTCRRALLSHRVVPSLEVEPALRHVDPDVVLDVGANRGQFALLARSLHRDALIHAFEPLATPARVLAEVFKDDERVVLHRHAVGTAGGSAPMHVPRRDDNASLRRPTDRQTTLFSGTESRRTEQVMVKRLDEVLAKDDLGSRTLLKIDVQGSELDVLESAASLVPRFRWVLVEVSFVAFYEGQPLADDVITSLVERGFGMHAQVNPTVVGGSVVQADFLFRQVDSVEATPRSTSDGRG